MNAFDLRHDYLTLLQKIEATCDEGGVIDAALMDELDAMAADIDTKLYNLAGMIRSLQAQSDICQDEIKRLSKQNSSAVNSIEFLKATAKGLLETTGHKEFQKGTRKLWIQNNPPSVEELDRSKIGPEHWIPQPAKLDKEGLLASLKAGVPCDGARIKQGNHLRCR